MAAIWPEIDWRVKYSPALRTTEVLGVTFINGRGTQRVKRYVLGDQGVGELVQEAKDKIRAHLTGKRPSLPGEPDLEYDRYDQDEGGPEERMLPGFV